MKEYTQHKEKSEKSLKIQRVEKKEERNPRSNQKYREQAASSRLKISCRVHVRRDYRKSGKVVSAEGVFYGERKEVVAPPDDTWP